MKKIYFENLNGLRFIAFLAIFLQHGIFTTENSVRDSFLFHVIELIKRPTYLGVPFFFCLSGFLITYLLLAEIEQHRKIHIGKFYMRRMLRIWFLYYAVIIFGFFIFPWMRSFFITEPYVETASIWKYLLFLSNFDQIEKGLPYGSGLGVTWSLSVEEQFYLVWPLILSVVKRKYFLHLTLFLFAFGNILLSFFNISYVNTLGSMTDISLGAFLAVISFDKNKLFDVLINTSKKTIRIIYLIGFIHIYSFTLFSVGHRMLISLFLAFVVFEQSFCPNSFIKMKKFHILDYLGTLTYGLYLFHTICNFVVHAFIFPFRKEINLPFLTDLLLQPALSLALTLAAGYLSFKYIEKPLLSLKMRFTLVNNLTEMCTPKLKVNVVQKIIIEKNNMPAFSLN